LRNAQQNHSKEELLSLPGEIGRSGGRLVVALRGEPKTLNLLIAADARSREVIGVMQADLSTSIAPRIQPNPLRQILESFSRRPPTYTLVLRNGLKFSDGQPMDADDVLFTFQSTSTKTLTPRNATS